MLHSEVGQLVRTLFAEIRRKPLVQVPALYLDPFAANLLKPGEVVCGGLGERPVDLAAGRQIKAPFPRLCAQALDCPLCLLAGDAFALAADHAMNALPIDHDVDAVAHVSVGLALGRDAVLREFSPGARMWMAGRVRRWKRRLIRTTQADGECNTARPHPARAEQWPSHVLGTARALLPPVRYTGAPSQPNEHRPR